MKLGLFVIPTSRYLLIDVWMSSEELEDFFGELEHVIIDEAQDITGVRLAFMKKIIEKLPLLWRLHFW